MRIWEVIDWFSDTYLTGKTCNMENQEAFCIFDLRYGQPINSAQSVWGIYYFPNKDGYLKFSRLNETINHV
ncbi:MAG: hypothetical protein U0T83_02870 [Bacteriovoracaceae bacterium]